MKYFVTFLLAMLPLAAFGQSVSRTELRSTNTLIDARMAQKAPTNSPTLFTPTINGAATFQGGTNAFTSPGVRGELTHGAGGSSYYKTLWWATSYQLYESDTGVAFITLTNESGIFTLTLLADTIVMDSDEVDVTGDIFGGGIYSGGTNLHALAAAPHREIIKTVAGVGGANTNFTLVEGEYQLNGKTNVHFVAIMGGIAGVSETCLALVTNRTATARTVSVSSVTNNWIPIGALSFPQSTTNSALWMSAKVRGSNVFYALQHVANPTD